MINVAAGREIFKLEMFKNAGYLSQLGNVRLNTLIAEHHVLSVFRLNGIRLHLHTSY